MWVRDGTVDPSQEVQDGGAVAVNHSRRSETLAPIHALHTRLALLRHLCSLIRLNGNHDLRK